MRDPTDKLEVRTLTENWAFLRRVARGLVPDGHEAEDLAQDAALAVLTGNGAPHSSERGWLRGILLNLSRHRWRSKARRIGREREAGHAAPAHSPPDAAIRAEVRRRVARAVREIEEPYRTVLVLRFVDGLGPTRISRRLSIPVRTVETRLRRGLAMLRARLDREYHGDRRAWCAPLLLLLARPRPVPAGLMVAGGIAALLVGTVLWGALPHAAAPVPIAPVEETLADRAATLEPESAPVAVTVPVEVAGTRAAPPRPRLAPQGYFEKVSGRVLDLRTGRPIPLAKVGYGTQVGFWWRVRTDDQGRFDIRARMPEDRLPFRLTVDAPDYEEWEVCPDRAEHTVHLVRRAVPRTTGSVVGVALDVEGRPVEGILEIASRRGEEGRFRLSAVADENGEFRLDGLEPGTWYFALSFGGTEWDVFVAEGDETPVTLRSTRMGGELDRSGTRPRGAVRVTGLEGRDGAVLQAVGARERWRTVIRDGAASFTSLPAGPHQFALFGTDGASRVANFALSDDPAGRRTVRFPATDTREDR